jgi:glycosyltransferase involved in cell wall biosynthesis
MKVSIVTICLNSEKTIEDTIRSVVSQTYPEIEYVVVDGGSKDGTLDIIDKYQKRIDKFVSEPDKGMYDAMNKGLNVASGEIIGFLNSDDLYASADVIDKIVSTIKEKGVKICWGDIVYFRSSQPNKVFRFWKRRKLSKGLDATPSQFFC